MEKRCYYEILGVERSANGDQLKKAYKQLALKWHPDRNPGDGAAEERFKEASEAFQVLNDPEKRSVYDRFGHEGLNGRSGFGDAEDIFSHFQDMFGDLFGGGFGRGGRRRDGAMRGEDLRVGVTLSLKDAAFGTKQEVDVAHEAPCEKCEGTGSSTKRREPCPTCAGRGQVAHARGPFLLQTTCPHCHGAGTLVRSPCGDCSGRGHVPVTRKVRVTIPAGIDDGQTLRVGGQGGPGLRGGPAGHLYVTVQVEPHEHFQRDGFDLVYELHVSFPQAALGADVEVPTLEGETRTVQVPAGVQPGESISVEDAGIPRLDGRGRGKLVAVVQVDVPKKLSAKAKKLLGELQKSLTET